MKAIINFQDHTITINEETQSFYAGGIFSLHDGNEPENKEEFLMEDYDNFLYERGIDEIAYIEEKRL